MTRHSAGFGSGGTMSDRQGYRIVVGVDGSPSSATALRWALRQAGLTGGTVTAVMAWDYPALSEWEIHNPAAFTSAKTKALAKVIRDVATEDTSQVVHKQVVQGHPAKALLDVAQAADLLVVGKRGRGGFSGALLGSVSQYCVLHVPCPVVVVREQRQW
jgi:nucleotide-binding universal stress UspA family protein